MANSLTPSFRIAPPIPPEAGHPLVVSNLNSLNKSNTDLNQAIVALTGRIGTVETAQTTAASTGTTSGGGSETVVIGPTTPAQNVIGSVNNQIGSTSYTTQLSDYGAFIVLDDASPIAVTLTGATAITTPWFCTLVNLGTSSATLTPATGTINGAATFTVTPNSATAVSYDGTNFWADPVAGGITSIIAGTGLTGGGSSGAVTVALATPVSIANGGTGTASPSLIAGTNVTITGPWPNQTINATGGGGGYSLGGTLAGTNVVLGTGAGAGATVAITGVDGAHVIAITTGTGCVAGGVVYTLNFTAPRSGFSAIAQPAGGGWGTYSSLNQIPFINSVSTGSYHLVAGSTALSDTSGYSFYISAP